MFKLKILDVDPKELTYYIKCIAEFYFSHIIIIGETNCGVIFLDCCGRVFLWDDENLLLWPLGDSPEEASKYTIKGKNRLGWFVENGIVYEYIKKPQCVYTKKYLSICVLIAGINLISFFQLKNSKTGIDESKF